jgi:hypothetical protein
VPGMSSYSCSLRAMRASPLRKAGNDRRMLRLNSGLTYIA